MSQIINSKLNIITSLAEFANISRVELTEESEKVSMVKNLPTGSEGKWCSCGSQHVAASGTEKKGGVMHTVFFFFF